MKAGDDVFGPNGEWGIVIERSDGALRIAWSNGSMTDAENAR